MLTRTIALALICSLPLGCVADIGDGLPPGCEEGVDCDEAVEEAETVDFEDAEPLDAYDEQDDAIDEEMGLLKDDEPAPELAAATSQDPTHFGYDGSEARYGIRIRDNRHAKPKIIYSLKLKNLGPDERLQLRSEVTLSYCATKDIAGKSGDAAITPCSSKAMKQSPYTYAPRFGAAFVLSDHKSLKGAKRVSPWRETICWREKHHCSLALPRTVVDNVPAATDKYVHLVVSADARGKNAKSWHVMEVEQHKGRLVVSRLAPEASRIQHSETNHLQTTGPLGIDQTEDEGDFTLVDHLFFRRKLTGLKPGDIVSADALLKVKLGGGFPGCDPLVTTQTFLTPNANAEVPKPKIRKDKPLTTRNGFNCTNHDGTACKYRDSGAAEVPKGAPSTMYVNVSAHAKRSCAAPNGGDKWRAVGGYLDVSVHR